MLALPRRQFPKFSWLNRRTLTAIGLIVGLPVILIGLARLMATEAPKSEVMEVARAVLEEHVRRIPPNKTWQMTATRVTEDNKLEMDVDIANYHQAKVIESRSGRVRYSYMKLACPDLDATVYQQLPKNETIWIQLHYNGNPIVRGACPLNASIF